VSTEWIVLLCSIKYVITITKKFTHSSSDGQVEDIFEGGNMILHENVSIRKINLQKTLEISEI